MSKKATTSNRVLAPIEALKQASRENLFCDLTTALGAFCQASGHEHKDISAAAKKVLELARQVRPLNFVESINACRIVLDGDPFNTDAKNFYRELTGCRYMPN